MFSSFHPSTYKSVHLDNNDLMCFFDLVPPFRREKAAHEDVSRALTSGSSAGTQPLRVMVTSDVKPGDTGGTGSGSASRGDRSMQPSSAPRYHSPGPVMAQFRGSLGAVSASHKVLTDLPWSADTAAAAERAQFTALRTEFRGIVASRVEVFEKKDLRQTQLGQAKQ